MSHTALAAGGTVLLSAVYGPTSASPQVMVTEDVVTSFGRDIVYGNA
jgi:hypothetical protein